MSNLPKEEIDRTFLPRMTALYAELNTVWTRHGETPDEVCDLIVQAAISLGEAILNAPVTCEEDIAHKLRFAAYLMSDKSGIVDDALPTVERALSDLMALREVQWHTDSKMLEGFRSASTAH